MASGETFPCPCAHLPKHPGAHVPPVKLSSSRDPSASVMSRVALRTAFSFVGGLLLGVIVARQSATTTFSTPEVKRRGTLSVPSPPKSIEIPPRLPSSGRGRARSSGKMRAADGARDGTRDGRGQVSTTAQPPQQQGEAWEAHTRGPYYGDLEQHGELARMIRTVSRSGEIVLLHGDSHRLRMLVNLIAELNALSIDHILLLGFNEATCVQMAVRRRIGCAHSSYLWDARASGEAGELAAHREKWDLARKYVAWIQKFRYVRLLIEARVNVLALDSDVVISTSP